MTARTRLLVLAIAGAIALSACDRAPSPEPGASAGASTDGAQAARDGETADQFIARVNAEIMEMYPEITVPQ